MKNETKFLSTYKDCARGKSSLQGWPQQWNNPFSSRPLHTFKPLQQIKSAPYKQSVHWQSRFLPLIILSLWTRQEVFIIHILQLPSLCSWPEVVASKCIWNKLTAFSQMRNWGSSAQIHHVVYVFDQSTKAGVPLSSLQSETFSSLTFSSLDWISNLCSLIKCLRMSMNSSFRSAKPEMQRRWEH